MLFFESLNGNKYVYIDDIGLIFPEEFAQVKNNLEEMSENQIFTKEYIEKWRNFLGATSVEKKEFTFKKLTTNELEEMIYRSGGHQLIIETTEDCNLRCKYCIYSDHYKDRRSFTQRYANWSTTKKAIDRYLDLVQKVYERNSNVNPTIGFYGGEPFLNFPVIKKAVEYVGQLDWPVKPSFHMTTNGTLLTNDEIIRFIGENNITISISLDGPEEEHNRNRVLRNGEGSFSRIKEAYKKLKDYPKDIKVSILSVYDWKSNLLKAEEFFESSMFPVPSRISLVNNTANTTYYDQFTKEDFKLFRGNSEILRAKFRQEVKENIYDRDSYSFSYAGTMNQMYMQVASVLTPLNDVFPSPGTCIPGKKIYVNVDGEFHVCERVSFAYPIGDVDKGIDLDKAVHLINEYQSLVQSRCIETDCPIKKICGSCYASFMREDCFEITDDACESKIDSFKNGLAYAVTLAEENKAFHETKGFAYYKQLNNYLGRD